MLQIYRFQYLYAGNMNINPFKQNAHELKRTRNKRLGNRLPLY